MAEVWTNTFVTDVVLWHCVWELRRIFGDERKTPRYIRTVPKSGYSLIAPVTWLAEDPSGRERSASASGETVPSIAVLPLVDVASAGNLDYLCEGLAEELIFALSRVRDLRVVARTSSVRFRDGASDLRSIGEKLGVGFVLEGSVRSAGGQLRINLQLIDAVTGFHIWSERYDLQLADAFASQERISAAVVEKMKLLGGSGRMRTVPAAVPENSETYILCLKGRYHWNRRSPEDFRKAIRNFEDAIALDPGCARAYAGLADCWVVPGIMALQAPAVCFPRAKAAAWKALELDESLAEAHAALGAAALHFDWDWPAAEQHLVRALELNPGWSLSVQWNALRLAVLGRTEEAFIWARRALSLDPLSAGSYLCNGWLFYVTRRYDQCLEMALRLESLEPNSVHVPFMRVHACPMMGRHDEARLACEKGSSLPGVELIFRTLAARTLALAGKPEEAGDVLARLRPGSIGDEYVNPYHVATALAALGRVDEALESLERGLDARCSFMCYVGLDPIFDILRPDPRFAEIMRRLRLNSPEVPRQEAPADN